MENKIKIIKNNIFEVEVRVFSSLWWYVHKIHIYKRNLNMELQNNTNVWIHYLFVNRGIIFFRIR